MKMENTDSGYDTDEFDTEDFGSKWIHDEYEQVEDPDIFLGVLFCFGSLVVAVLMIMGIKYLLELFC